MGIFNLEPPPFHSNDASHWKRWASNFWNWKKRINSSDGAGEVGTASGGDLSTVDVNANGTVIIGNAGSAASTEKMVVSNNATDVQPGDNRTLVHIASKDDYSGRLMLDGYNCHIPLTFRRAQGTAASPSAMIKDQSFGGISAWGYGSTGYNSGPNSSRVGIDLLAEENWTDTAQGTRMVFYTTETGTDTEYERVRIAHDGKVGIGTGSDNPTALLTLSQSSAAPQTPPTDTNFQMIGADSSGNKAVADSFASPSLLIFRRADGTNASPSATQSGDNIGGMQAFGYGATGYVNAAAADILLRADGNFTDSSIPGKIVFRTTASGATSPTERFSIDNAGDLYVAGTKAASGTFTTADSKTVTVTNGLITSIA